MKKKFNSHGFFLFSVALLALSSPEISARQCSQSGKGKSQKTVVFCLQSIPKGTKIRDQDLQERVIDPSNGPFDAIECRRSANNRIYKEDLGEGQILLKADFDPPLTEKIDAISHRTSKHATFVIAKRKILKGQKVSSADVKQDFGSPLELGSDTIARADFVIGNYAKCDIPSGTKVTKLLIEHR